MKSCQKRLLSLSIVLVFAALFYGMSVSELAYAGKHDYETTGGGASWASGYNDDDSNDKYRSDDKSRDHGSHDHGSHDGECRGHCKHKHCNHEHHNNCNPKHCNHEHHRLCKSHHHKQHHYKHRYKPDKHWLTSGNKYINPCKYFLGTRDESDLVIRTDNVERVRITAEGNVGIGTCSPTGILHVEGGIADGAADGADILAGQY